MKTITLTLHEACTLAFQTLSHNGLSEVHAEVLAGNMTAAERDGCPSHGLWRLLSCVHSVRQGKVSPNALPLIYDHAPAIVRADAQGAFSLLAFNRSLAMLVDKARHHGLAALIINHCVHFSALWADIEPLTGQGLVALACTPTQACVAPAGGNRPLFGTNPLAFGWPRAGRAPFIFDMATSVAARGEIQLHQRAGQPLPQGWGIDSTGKPSTDASAVLEGAMLPFGGYKGSALALMIELIAGPLIADMTSVQSRDWDNGAGGLPYGGELILALDPQRFSGGDLSCQLEQAETLFSALRAQGARLPGERRYQHRQQSERQGITISQALYADIMALNQ